MRIVILGSMSFIKDIIRMKKKLNKLGHKAVIPYGTEPHQKDNAFVDNLKGNMRYCIENNVMKRNFALVAQNDAVLVLNNKKTELMDTSGYLLLWRWE